MKAILCFAMALLFTVGASAQSAKKEQVISAETDKALYFLSRYCSAALTEATKEGEWIGSTVVTGDWSSNQFTINYNMFRQTGFFSTEAAGTVELIATPVEVLAADGPSFNVECSYIISL